MNIYFTHNSAHSTDTIWYVNQVTPGSPAERAGFRPGDVVVEFDGRPVESIKEVTNIIIGDVSYKIFLYIINLNSSTVDPGKIQAFTQPSWGR
jgi:membrane-associated protease RseP (regulator of RpoE activity)